MEYGAGQWFVTVMECFPDQPVCVGTPGNSCASWRILENIPGHLAHLEHWRGFLVLLPRPHLLSPWGS